MALLSCSSRRLASSFGAPHSTRPLAHSPSCPGGKFSKSASCKSASAISGREFQPASATSLVRSCDSAAQSQHLFGRFYSSGIVASRADDQWHKVRGRDSDSTFGPTGVFDDETQEVGPGLGGGSGRRSTLLCSCAGIALTPGIASSALPLPAVTMHDLLACVITIAGALSLLKVFDELAKRDVLEKKLSRKLVHIVVGLGFMLFWPLFSTSAYAKYLCALAPAINAVRMLGIGFGLLESESMIKAMSRDGDRRELLKGPFYYALAIVVTTVCFWRTSPVGIVALVNLCSGDGFADIIGRNFGGDFKLPWNEDKSWAGSVGFWVASTGVSMLYLLYFAHFGFLQIQPGTFVGVAIVSLLTALVESLPISTRLDDNLTVPFSAMAFGQLILPS